MGEPPLFPLLFIWKRCLSNNREQRITQPRFYKKREHMILVFVGAGGSAAVDPKQYPTTLEFFNLLPDSITTNTLFTSVKGFLTGPKKKEKGTIDIEDVLETLNELQVNGQRAIDKTKILGWTLGGELGFISGVSFDALAQSMEQLIKTHAAPLASEIHRQVYDLYAEEPDPTQLKDWVSLLSGLAEIDPAIEIFTTNYDLVLESLIPLVKPDIKTGRDSTSGIQTRLDITPWLLSMPDDPSRPSGLLTKLHGSVDWQRGRKGKINISDTDTGSDDKHCILYPGHKGEPTEEPFKVFHEYFRRVIRSRTLSAAVFVGFAFRDEYINFLLADLPKDTPTVFVTKDNIIHLDRSGPPTGAPAVNSFIHISAGLTSHTPELCLEYLRENKRKK